MVVVGEWFEEWCEECAVGFEEGEGGVEERRG